MFEEHFEDMEQYFENIDSIIKKIITKKMSKYYVEFNEECLPRKRGVYFIYKKNGDNIEDNPSYIGCAYKNDRNIKKKMFSELISRRYRCNF